MDSLPLELFMGPAIVHAVDAERYIAEEHMRTIDLGGATRVLFKTRNSQLLQKREYDPDFVAFSEGAARALGTRGSFPLKLHGLDGAPCRAVLRELG